MALLSLSLSGNLPVRTERGALCTISRIFNMTHAPCAIIKNLRLGKLIKKNNNPAHNSRVNSFSLNKSCLHFIKSSALPAACQKTSKKKGCCHYPCSQSTSASSGLGLKKTYRSCKVGQGFPEVPSPAESYPWGHQQELQHSSTTGCQCFSLDLALPGFAPQVPAAGTIYEARLSACWLSCF